MQVPVTARCRPVASAGTAYGPSPPIFAGSIVAGSIVAGSVSAGSGRKAQVTRDTAGNPGGGGARRPRRPAERRLPDAATAGDESRSTGLTGPQRAFPVWDGVPGFEFEGGRAARRPPPPAPAPEAPGGEGRRFRYTPTVSQPRPV